MIEAGECFYAGAVSHRALPIALAAAALALGACGSDEDKGPREVAQACADAVAADDGAAACALLPRGFFQGIGQKQCAAGYNREFREEGAEDLGEVTDVEVEGDTARANFSGGGFLDLTLIRDEWYLDLVR